MGLTRVGRTTTDGALPKRDARVHTKVAATPYERYVPHSFLPGPPKAYASLLEETEGPPDLDLDGRSGLTLRKILKTERPLCEGGNVHPDRKVRTCDPKIRKVLVS